MHKFQERVNLKQQKIMASVNNKSVRNLTNRKVNIRAGGSLNKIGAGTVSKNEHLSTTNTLSTAGTASRNLITNNKLNSRHSL